MSLLRSFCSVKDDWKKREKFLWVVSVKEAKVTSIVLNVKTVSDVKACLLILWNDRELLISLLDMLATFSISHRNLFILHNHTRLLGSISYFIFTSLLFSVRIYQGMKCVLSCLVLW